MIGRVRSSLLRSSLATGQCSSIEEFVFAVRNSRPVASAINQRNKSLTWIMPRGSSSVSRNSGMRETPASSKVLRSSPIGSFSSSAVISARGTIRSSTRLVLKRNNRPSMRRSASVKAAPVSGVLSASSIVSRNVCGPDSPSFRRNTCIQPCAPGCRGSSGRISGGILSCVGSFIVFNYGHLFGKISACISFIVVEGASVGISDTDTR